MALLCHEHKRTAPHYAQLNSQPPRCRRHFLAYTAHQSTMRSRKSRGQDTWPYDPGRPGPEDTGSLMLDTGQLIYLLGLLGKTVKARADMFDAVKAKDWGVYRQGAEDLSALAKTLDDWFDKDLRLVEIVDKAIEPRR